MPGPEVIKLFGVHFRARVEFLLQISKIGGHQQNLHISSTILCSTRDSDSKQISDSKTEVIKLFEIVFMLELEYETPNFKLAAYLTSKQTQNGDARSIEPSGTPAAGTPPATMVQGSAEPTRKPGGRRGLRALPI